MKIKSLRARNIARACEEEMRFYKRLSLAITHLIAERANESYSPNRYFNERKEDKTTEKDVLFTVEGGLLS